MNIDIMKHAVGLDKIDDCEYVREVDGRKEMMVWRNRYYTYSDLPEMLELEEAGFMVPEFPTKPSCYWHVTEAGMYELERVTGVKLLSEEEWYNERRAF